MLTFKKQERYLLIALLFVGAVLRLINLNQVAFTHDELSALARLQFATLNEVIEKGIRPDGHPAGVQLFLYYWIKIFGSSEVAVKLPFILLGIGSLYLVFLIGCKWFNSTVAFITLAFMVSMEYPIMYSQIARPYSSGLFFGLLMVWCWTNLLFSATIQTYKSPYCWGYLLATLACAYDHHMALLFALIVGLTGLVFIRSRSKVLWAYLLAGVLIVLGYWPHLSITLSQMHTGGVGGPNGWLSAPEPRWIIDYLRYLFHFSAWVYWLVISLVSYGIYTYFKTNRKDRLQPFQWLSLIWFLVFFLIQYAYSVKVNPILQYSTLIFAFPYLLYFVFSFCPLLPFKTQSFIVVIVLTINLYTLLVNRQYYHLIAHQPYEQQVKFANRYSDKGNCTVEIPMFPYILNYYQRKTKSSFAANQFAEVQAKLNTQLDQSTDPLTQELLLAQAFDTYLSKQKSTYFVAGNLSSYQLEIIRHYYPVCIGMEQGFTYSVYCFSKFSAQPSIQPSALTSAQPIEHLATQTSTSEVDPIRTLTSYIDPEQPVVLKPEEEYSKGISMPISDLKAAKSDRLCISARVNTTKPTLIAKGDSTASKQDTLFNPILVVELRENGKTLRWSGQEYAKQFHFATEIDKLSNCLDLSGFDATIHPNAELYFYIWNKGKNHLTISNLVLQARLGNPLIYGLFQPFH